MIYTESDSGVVFLAQMKERNEAFPDFCDSGIVFLIGVFSDVKYLTIHIITRIDTYLLHYLSSGICSFGVKVNIGNKRICISSPGEFLSYHTQVFGFPDSLSREPDIICSGIDDAYGLFDTCIGIQCGYIGH